MNVAGLARELRELYGLSEAQALEWITAAGGTLPAGELPDHFHTYVKLQVERHHPEILTEVLMRLAQGTNRTVVVLEFDSCNTVAITVVGDYRTGTDEEAIIESVTTDMLVWVRSPEHRWLGLCQLLGGTSTQEFHVLDPTTCAKEHLGTVLLERTLRGYRQTETLVTRWPMP